MARSAATEVTVDGRRLRLSNLHKPLYPAGGLSKGDVIAYYSSVAPAMLGHLRDRPLTLKRYPDGVEGEFFYEKQCPKHRPDWVRTERIRARGTGRFGAPKADGGGPKDIDFCVIDDLPGLVWVANLAALELHTSLSRAGDHTTPTMVVFDLDPGEPAGLIECASVALELRALMDRLGLESVAKTSGSKGIQVYLPLNGRASYEQTKGFAQALAQLLEERHPELVVSRMRKDLRGGKVFVDWNQNEDFKTTVCAYSLRARERPTVSTPVAWDELEAAVEAGEPARLVFEAGEVLERVEREGDLFAPAVELEQELPAL